jgi:hypothetical protein
MDRMRKAEKQAALFSAHLSILFILFILSILLPLQLRFPGSNKRSCSTIA